MTSRGFRSILIVWTSNSPCQRPGANGFWPSFSSLALRGMVPRKSIKLGGWMRHSICWVESSGELQLIHGRKGSGEMTKTTADWLETTLLLCTVTWSLKPWMTPTTKRCSEHFAERWDEKRIKARWGWLSRMSTSQ